MESIEVALPPCMLPSVSTPVEAHPSESTVTNPPCAWGKVLVPEAVSLDEVMSEQLATSLQLEEERAALPPQFKEEEVLIPTVDPDCSDDFLLAQMLQLEFDKEHDTVLRQEEKKYNGSSKVYVSFGKYLRLPDSCYSDDDDNDSDDTVERRANRHWHNYDQAEKTFQSVGKSGICRQGNTTTTKHDATVCGRRNACKLMEFPPGISTGDGGGFDMKLSNNVYNTLKLHSMAEDRRSHRLHDKKEKSTAEKALDVKTRLILYKLVSGQVLETLTGCISTGKEACVYHAWSGPLEDQEMPREYALKVYKTTLNEFQNRDQYIREDHRFRDRFGKQNPRKIIHMWAEKEMRNLSRMMKANIPCPEVIILKKHVLVMSFIGTDTRPAPKLKDVQLPFDVMTLIYEQTVEIMKKLYKDCSLVHADMSEYNLLWHQDLIWVIDVSQSVEITHPRALNFLIRDCTNISNFFEKKGVLNVLKPNELYTEICGRQLPKH